EMGGESHAFYEGRGYFGDIRKAAFCFLKSELNSEHCTVIQIFMRLCRCPDDGEGFIFWKAYVAVLTVK
ncbi:MAG: hypothetical protein KGJ02_08155, partial [Verrucomicrobiota bacterium]|nr:hypothetical protein [Verrucomicrobiota bacterium]